MKKLLFAAVLATVAIAGASSANALTLYRQGSSTPIVCEQGEATCIDVIGQGTKVYSFPNATSTDTPVDPSLYQNLEYQL